MSTADPTGALTPEAAPAWLKPLIENVGKVPTAYRRRLPRDVIALFAAANATAALGGRKRDAAVLVLFSGPEDDEARPGRPPREADLLLTVRASTLRHHAGQAAFPGGASDPGDAGPVDTALREACEETGLNPTRLRPLATLDRIFIPPSGFHVVPVLAYSPDPGSVAVVDHGETAHVARVPLRAFANPDNRLMVYRAPLGARYAGPAFLLNEMLVWGFTGHVIAAMLDVAGWAVPWNTDDVRELDEAIALVGALGPRAGGGGQRDTGPIAGDAGISTGGQERWGHHPPEGQGDDAGISTGGQERSDAGISTERYGEAQ